MAEVLPFNSAHETETEEACVTAFVQLEEKCRQVVVYRRSRVNCCAYPALFFTKLFLRRVEALQWTTWEWECLCWSAEQILYNLCEVVCAPAECPPEDVEEFLFVIDQACVKAREALEPLLAAYPESFEFQLERKARFESQLERNARFAPA